MLNSLKKLKIHAINFPINHLSEINYVRYIMLLSRVYRFGKSPYLFNYSRFFTTGKLRANLHRVSYGENSITFQSGYRINRFLKGFDNAGKALWDRYRIEELTLGEIPSAILDVGANIGEFSLYANKKFGNSVKILAIEPDPIASACLKNNLNSTEIVIQEVGVSNNSGSQEFFLKTSSADSSLHNPMGDSLKIRVELKRIDQLISENSLAGPILIKMDTEGHEPEALLGASGAIDDVKWIAVDTGPERSGKRTTEQVMKVLSDFGFNKIHVSSSDILIATRK